MVWYKDLYADESISHRIKRIKWKVRHNAGQTDTYLIVLGQGEKRLLEIISTIELMQKHYPKDQLFVIGVAKGYEQACELACKILLEVYEKTTDFDVKSYILQKQYAENGQVNICP